MKSLHIVMGNLTMERDCCPSAHVEGARPDICGSSWLKT